VWQRWREQVESELIRLKFRVQSLDFAIRDWNLWFSERDWNLWFGDWNLTRETREVRVHRAVRDSSVSEKWVYREWELGRSWSNERSVMMVRAEIDSGGSESILQLGFAMCERDEIVFFFWLRIDIEIVDFPFKQKLKEIHLKTFYIWGYCGQM
jgi:hypothetical protein